MGRWSVACSGEGGPFPGRAEATEARPVRAPRSQGISGEAKFHGAHAQAKERPSKIRLAATRNALHSPTTLSAGCLLLTQSTPSNNGPLAAPGKPAHACAYFFQSRSGTFCNNSNLRSGHPKSSSPPKPIHLNRMDAQGASQGRRLQLVKRPASQHLIC